MNDVALICGDGAVKGGFVAGAVVALQELFPSVMENLAVVAATSASVGSMCYFLSHGEDHPGEDIWNRALASKNFINYQGIRSFFSDKPLYDIDYMADVIFKRDHPLDIERILNSPTEFYVPVQRYDTNDIEYFSNRGPQSFIRDGKSIPIHSMREVDIYEMIKASNSAPFVFDKPIGLIGNQYIDAATLEPFIMDLPALKGKRRIVIITKNKQRVNKSLDYALSGYSWPFLVTPFKSRKFKSEIYFQYARKPETMRRLAKELETLERYDRTVVVSPAFRLGSITDNSETTLRKNYQHGIDTVKSMREQIEQTILG